MIRSSQFQVKFQLEAVKQKQLFAPIKTDVSNQMNQSKFRARRSRAGKRALCSNNVALDFQANHIAYPIAWKLLCSVKSHTVELQGIERFSDCTGSSKFS